MAAASSILRSQINVKVASESVASLSKGIDKAQKSANSIGETLIKRNRFKREAIAQDKISFFKRREAVRRKEQEEIIEASNLRGAEGRTRVPMGAAIVESTKGFLGRILDYVGTVFVGWLLNNLPTIIETARNLITRIQSVVRVLGGFVVDVTSIIFKFGNVLGSLATNIVNFDFTDDSKRVQTSFTELEDAVNSLGTHFDDAIKLFTTPLGEGPEEKEAPPIGTEYPAEVIGEPSGPSTPGSGGTKYPELASMVVKGEGGINSVNRGNAGDTPGGAKSIFGKNLTDMTIGEIMQAQRAGRVFAVGKYQFIPDTLAGAVKYTRIPLNTKFDSATQNRLFDYLIDVKRPEIGAYINGKSNDRRTAIQQLAREFASVGLEYPEAGRVRGQSRYAGTGGNRASISPEAAGAALDRQRKSGPSSATPTAPSAPGRTPSAPPAPTVSGQGGKVVEYLTGDRTHRRYRADHAAGNYHDHIAFDSQKTRDAAIKWLRGKGWSIGSINTGRHAEGSYHYSNQAFDIPFYPNQSIKGVTDDAKGETLLSSMLRRDLNSGGFGGSQLGGSATNAAQTSSSSSPPPAPTRAVSQPAQPLVEPTQPLQIISEPIPNISAQISQPPSNLVSQVQSITPERIGNQVIVAPQQLTPQQPSQGPVNPAQDIQMNEPQNLLNTFMVTRLLLDLAYT